MGSTGRLASLAVNYSRAKTAPRLLVNRNPRVVCLYIRTLDCCPGDHVRPLFAIEFSGMRRVRVIERFAVNIVGVLGQMFSDTRGQIGVHSVGHC